MIYTDPGSHWQFNSEEDFVSLSGAQSRVVDRLPWPMLIFGVIVYAALGVLDQYIPNPMLPGASIALAMVVPVVAGALRGVRTGAVVGLLGTILLLSLETLFFAFNPFEVCGLLAHPVMGAAAGWLASRSRQQIVPGLAILLGHGLNLLAYVLLGLLPAALLLKKSFLIGLTAETAIDLILFSLMMTLIRRQNSTNFQKHSFRRVIGAWSSVIFLLLAMVWAYQKGTASILPLLILPVALAAILLGPLAAWLSALIPTSLLALDVFHRGLESSRQEVMTILGLNLVALILGEMAAGLRRQKNTALRRAHILAAISHAAEQLLEHEDWESRLSALLDTMAQAAESPGLALYESRGNDLCLHSRSQWPEGKPLPERIPQGPLSDSFWKGHFLIGVSTRHRGHRRPQSLLLPVHYASKISGALLVLAERQAMSWKTPLRDALRVAADLLGAALHRRTTEDALAVSEERYALAARGASDGLWDWDLKADSLYLSDRWFEMLGLPPNSLDHRIESWLQLINPSDRTRFQRRLHDHLAGATERLEVEYRIRHRDGQLRWMLCRGLAIRDTEERPTRLAGSQTDITDRKKAEEQILRDAFFDRLTGLPNRALMLDRLQIACRRASQGQGNRVTVLLMDIDRLKLVNDSYGHDAGDELIRKLAFRVAELAGENKTTARIGSDDLAILIEEEDSPALATLLFEDITEALRRPFNIGEHSIFVTLSTGIASYSLGGSTAEQLLQDADTALAEAKARGRARMVLFVPTMRDSTVRKLSLETELRRALEREELRLFYQPIVRLENGELTGFEALMRWENPNRGMIGPDDFISVAEEAGLIVGLGEWALVEACRTLSQWKKQFPGRRITCSVNLHSHQFRQEDLVELVSGTLKKLELPSEILRLEVTEQAMMEDQRFAVHLMEELQHLGVNLYIDDFGTGYSSLAYLVRLPVSTLKIDQSFIKGMEDDPKKRQMVEVILQLARTLQLEVVAEGIEEAVHVRFLRERGCDYGQGYLFAEPLPVSKATDLIASAWTSPNCRD